MNYNYLKMKDRTYAYTIEGKGEPLVLLHGFTGSNKTWGDCARIWSKSFQVISLDLPGHGQTRSPSLTIEEFCEDLSMILKELNVEKVHILGYSMGGRIALSFAIYYPDFVRTLILESASPGLKTERERKDRRKADALLAEQIIINGVANFTSYWESIPLFQTQKQLPKVVKEKIRMERLSQKPEGLAESLLFMGTGRQPSWWGELSKLKIPVALITGREDNKFVQINKEMKKQIKRADSYIVEGAGHAVHIEQREKFAKIVMKFIKEKTYIKEGAIDGSTLGESKRI